MTISAIALTSIATYYLTTGSGACYKAKILLHMLLHRCKLQSSANNSNYIVDCFADQFLASTEPLYTEDLLSMISFNEYPKRISSFDIVCDGYQACNGVIYIFSYLSSP